LRLKGAYTKSTEAENKETRHGIVKRQWKLAAVIKPTSTSTEITNAIRCKFIALIKVTEAMLGTDPKQINATDGSNLYCNPIKLKEIRGNLTQK
jgi:hypothetical protein